ncbi:4-diphosphocytidyl-2-C-methyl-D-erythritol kinase [bioreactor metagenome]|uniref:4-(cytidine 5'-diphospho)-2-C-methyl-D-erythritol kinase n=1 Tax=bioreactor metagenome TaxID=1076179 RepID=A0A644TRW6_9ZZZZ|nr:4-(cytidine 5'-diphospho)-2-C-methyl-D-erythritol kinase [Negativicutes bacterium]
MLTVKAYAKINLALDILGKRQDGYHEVVMIMQTISLADTVVLREQDGGIALSANISALACDDTNLAYRAAALIKQEFDIKTGVAIELTKKIPMAAGLAGGSADAAAVLAGLNALWKLNLTADSLKELGSRLGSDVPFCLQGGTALATGRGEVLKQLPALPECYIVLAKPAISVSTAWAYGHFRPEKINQRPDIKGMIGCLESGKLAGVNQRLCNVFENIVIAEHPIIGSLKQALCDSGCAALMSGSGPTVFGITENLEAAEAAAQRLSSAKNAEIFIAKTMSKAGDNIGTEIAAN